MRQRCFRCDAFALSRFFGYKCWTNMSQSEHTSTRSRPPWYFYVLGASFLGYFVLFWYLHHVGLGFGFDTDSDNVVIVRSGSQAERAGVQTGDRWVASDGRPPNGTDDYMLLKAGDTKTLRFRRNGQDFDVTLTATSADTPTDDFTFLAPKFALLALAFVIALLRPRDGTAGIGALFLAAMSVFLSASARMVTVPAANAGAGANFAFYSRPGNALIRPAAVDVLYVLSQTLFQIAMGPADAVPAGSSDRLAVRRYRVVRVSPAG